MTVCFVVIDAKVAQAGDVEDVALRGGCGVDA